MIREDAFWRKFELREEWACRSSDCAALKTSGTSVISGVERSCRLLVIKEHASDVKGGLGFSNKLCAIKASCSCTILEPSSPFAICP